MNEYTLDKNTAAYTPARAHRLDRLEYYQQTQKIAAAYTPARARRLDRIFTPAMARRLDRSFTRARAHRLYGLSMSIIYHLGRLPLREGLHLGRVEAAEQVLEHGVDAQLFPIESVSRLAVSVLSRSIGRSVGQCSVVLELFPVESVGRSVVVFLCVRERER
jgi:hypothetical protein